MSFLLFIMLGLLGYFCFRMLPSIFFSNSKCEVYEEWINEVYNIKHELMSYDTRYYIRRQIDFYNPDEDYLYLNWKLEHDKVIVWWTNKKPFATSSFETREEALKMIKEMDENPNKFILKEEKKNNNIVYW